MIRVGTTSAKPAGYCWMVQGHTFLFFSFLGNRMLACFNLFIDRFAWGWEIKEGYFKSLIPFRKGFVDLWQLSLQAQLTIIINVTGVFDENFIVVLGKVIFSFLQFEVIGIQYLRSFLPKPYQWQEQQDRNVNNIGKRAGAHIRMRKIKFKRRWERGRRKTIDVSSINFVPIRMRVCIQKRKPPHYKKKVRDPSSSISRAHYGGVFTLKFPFFISPCHPWAMARNVQGRKADKAKAKPLRQYRSNYSFPASSTVSESYPR